MAEHNEHYGDNRLYLDDLHIGQRFTSKSHAVTRRRSRRSLASSTRSPFTSMTKPLRAPCSLAWRRAAGTPWRSRGRRDQLAQTNATGRHSFRWRARPWRRRRLGPAPTAAWSQSLVRPAISAATSCRFLQRSSSCRAARERKRDEYTAQRKMHVGACSRAKHCEKIYLRVPGLCLRRSKQLKGRAPPCNPSTAP